MSQSYPTAKEAQAYRRKQAEKSKKDREHEAEYNRAHSADQGKEGWEAQLAEKEGKLRAVDPRVVQWAAKALPNTPPPQAAQAGGARPSSAWAKAGVPEPYSKEWFEQQQEQDRIRKTDALIRQHREEAQAGLQREHAESDRSEKKAAGRGFPTLSGIVNDSGAVLKKMKLLEDLTAQHRVRYNGDEVDPKVPLSFFQGELIKLSTAVIKMLEMSDRDLGKIINGHQGTKDADLAKRVRDDFKLAYANAGLSVQSFNSNKFQDGVKQLARAMRLDRAASTDVSDWAGDVISQADLCAKTAQSVRDTALDGLQIAAMAGPGGAVVYVIRAAKVAAKVSDSMIEKGEVPWVEIATDWIIGKVGGAVLGRISGFLGAKVVPEMEKRLLKKLGDETDAKLASELIKRAAAQVGDIMKSEVEDLAKAIRDGHPGPNERPLAYIERIVAQKFSLEHLGEMLKKHLLEDRMVKPGWKALVSAL